MTEESALFSAVVNGEFDRTAELAVAAMNSGLRPQEIISKELQTAMVVVGEKYSSGEYFLPDMLLAARAMERAVKELEPFLGNDNVPALGKIVIGQVKGDIHTIGRNIVVTFLNGVGFEVINLGEDVPDEEFIQEVREKKPDILGLSALLTTTMPALKSVIKALDEAGLRNKVKVVVGGAPVTQGYADSIGADGYAGNGGEAVRVCKELMNAREEVS